MTRTRLFAAIAMAWVATGCTNDALLERARDSTETAESLIQEGRQLAPSEPEAATNRFNRAQQALIEARNAYLAARADRSEVPELLEEFARVAEQLTDYDLAGEALLRAAELRPENAELWFRAGRNFVDAGGAYLGQAAHPLQRAEQLSSGDDSLNARILTARGEIFWKQGMHAAAHELFVEANRYAGVTDRGRLAVIASSLATGEVLAAQNAIENLDDPALLQTPFGRRGLREAYLVYRQLRLPSPDDPEGLLALAKIAVRLGFVEDGRLAVERSIEQGGEDIVTLNLAGSLAAQAGDTDRAQELFTRSLELDPNQPRTRQALEQLPSAGAPR